MCKHLFVVLSSVVLCLSDLSSAFAKTTFNGYLPNGTPSGATCSISLPSTSPTVIYKQSTSPCNLNEVKDFPDVPIRCFTVDNGQFKCYWGNAAYGTRATLFSNSSRSWDFVKRYCTNVLPKSPNKNIPNNSNNGGPDTFQNRYWLNSLWKTDDNNIVAIIHNEFHGWETDPKKYCPSSSHTKCWYPNSIAASSNDKGQSFKLMTTNDNKQQLVISTPYQYVPDGGNSSQHQGVVHTSNIIKHDSDYYILAQSSVGSTAHPSQSGVCVYRTQSIQDPTSWLGWHNGQFSVQNINPYPTKATDPENHICQPIPTLKQQGIYSLNGWTYNTALNRYLAVGIDKNQIIAVVSQGDDVTKWQLYHPLMKINWISDWVKSKPGSGLTAFAYCSIIDLTSRSLDPSHEDQNFMYSGKNPWLVCTRFNPKQSRGRDNTRDIVGWKMKVDCP